MKQVLQNLRTGETRVEDVPAPLVRPGHVRIATSVTLVSAGTERMLVNFARGSLVSKALQQPQRVREVLEKVRTDGLMTTAEAVLSKLDQPMTLGYCNVGRVVESQAEGFSAGQRVISNGPHAEVAVAPRNLCARIPDAVSDEHAAFTVIGAIALQGLRLAEPTLGERFAVVGLGLIGQLAVQLLAANGCRVLAIDTDGERLALARTFGAETVDLSRGEDPLARAKAFSAGRGMDGVILALSSDSDTPVAQAAQMCRKRGRVVLVGVTGLNLNRADFFEKEISFQVSCSYGPGRYDPDYEMGGRDYPFGFVRWTEQRNFEAVLDMVAAGRLQIEPLISHRFAIDDAGAAYDLISSGHPSLGILLTYPQSPDLAAHLPTSVSIGPAVAPSSARMGFIGAGNYGGRVLVKAFRKAGAGMQMLASAGGVSALHYGRKFGFDTASSDAEAVIGGELDAVCISTRHDSHARFAEAALRAGKHVFVEKPLCLTLQELSRLQDATRGSSSMLMVGFNRRFAPMVVRAKSLLDTLTEPKVFIMTVNAGAIPADSWVQDPLVGGGRIVGEACHFIDLFRHLAGSPVESFEVASVARPGGPPLTDVASITLRFCDGSVGVINYLANGHKALPKERLEIFAGGRVLVLDNFRRLTGHGWPGFSSMHAMRQDKGQDACAAAFVEALRGGGAPPIPQSEIFEVSELAIRIAARLA